MLPTLLAPEELADGAVVSGNYRYANHRTPTYVYQNHPVLEAFARRGIRPAGVVVFRGYANDQTERSSAADMPAALPRMAALALRLGAGEPLGPAAAEGYLPRGIRRNRIDPEPAAERAVAGLLAKLAGQPYATEVPLPVCSRVPPPPPLPDLRRATLALVTEGGIVPRGNPDGLPSARADRWLKYSLAGLDDLTPEGFESIHSGYDTRAAKADPDRVAPLDALRLLERRGRIGRLHPYLYTTTGNVTSVASAVRFGREIAADLRQAGVDAAVLTAT